MHILGKIIFAERLETEFKFPTWLARTPLSQPLLLSPRICISGQLESGAIAGH